MQILAFDVHYVKDGCMAAAVLFTDYGAAEPKAEFTRVLSQTVDYIPGAFYRRELPCILALLDQIDKPPDEMVIDGYVTLGKRPGLGQHLYNSLGGRIPVIGVAKSRFKGSPAIETYRGGSRLPLYVTAAGMDPKTASKKIKSMHGAYRIPTLLKRVDRLARETARQSIKQ